MNGIILTNITGNAAERTTSFQIVNNEREIKQDIYLENKDVTIYLRASACPENQYPTLFLQGTDVTREDRVVTASIEEFRDFVSAILQYNRALDLEYSGWADSIKYPCTACGGEFSPNAMSEAHPDYCKACVETLKICAGCGALGATHVFGTDIFCNNCVSQGSVCQVCATGNKVTRNRSVTVPEDYHGRQKNVRICPDCWGKELVLGGEHHYHYRPEQFYFWDIKGVSKKTKSAGKRVCATAPQDKVLYMGTEIEAIFPKNSHTNIVIAKILEVYGTDKEKLVYAKHDGTVPDPGTELVTHPMTLSMIRSLSWEGLFKQIIMPETKAIGGHMHLNKTAFWTPGHVYKFLKFMRTNIEFVEFIGERPLQADWCKSRSGDGSAVQLAKSYVGNKNSDRYEMINFTQDTIELRFFFTPTTAAALYKNAEFVDSLYNYTINAPLHFTCKDYTTYVEARKTDYPHLAEYLAPKEGHTFLTNGENANVKPKDKGRCASCGRSFDEHSDVHSIDGRTLCSYCVRTCDFCGITHTTASSVRVNAGDEDMCPACTLIYRQCTSCGEYTHRDSLDSVGVCDRCNDTDGPCSTDDDDDNEY